MDKSSEWEDKVDNEYLDLLHPTFGVVKEQDQLFRQRDPDPDEERIFDQQDLERRASLRLTPRQMQAAKDLLVKYSDVFVVGDTMPTATTGVEHDIQLQPGTSLPLCPGMRRRTEDDHRIIEEEVKRLLNAGVISRASGITFACQVVLVKKPGKTPRLTIDYTPLNAITRPDAYPIPRLDDILISFAGTKVFSCADAARGFWQVPIKESARRLTAFKVRSGIYVWNRMPMGLINAPATFCAWVDDAFQGLDFIQTYIDDFTIASTSVNQHLDHLQQMLERCRTKNIRLRQSKCLFFQHHVELLGHEVGTDGMRPQAKKVDAIAKMERPRSLKQMQSFLGMVQFYRGYVENLAIVAAPLYELTKKTAKWRSNDPWKEEHDRAFEKIRDVLSSRPLLAFPDFTTPFYIRTDASAYGIGGTLVQFRDDRLQVVEYWSQSLNKHERNYSTTKREALAMMKVLA